MRVLSFSQPWLWSILHAGKSIENRKWMPPIETIGQRFALHAAKSWDDEGIRFFIANRVEHPHRRDLYAISAIVGVATIDRIVSEERTLTPAQKRWFFGPYGWLLSDVRKLASPIPHKGAQGFRHLPQAIVDQINQQLESAA